MAPARWDEVAHCEVEDAAAVDHRTADDHQAGPDVHGRVCQDVRLDAFRDDHPVGHGDDGQQLGPAGRQSASAPQMKWRLPRKKSQAQDSQPQPSWKLRHSAKQKPTPKP